MLFRPLLQFYFNINALRKNILSIGILLHLGSALQTKCGHIVWTPVVVKIDLFIL